MNKHGDNIIIVMNQQENGFVIGDELERKKIYIYE